jgi:hypothetical protein
LYNPVQTQTKFGGQSLLTIRQIRIEPEEETTMHRQVVFAALFAALIIGNAAPARASDRDTGPRGYQVQTWQDIERAGQDIQRQVDALEHKGGAGTSYGYTKSRSERHASHR